MVQSRGINPSPLEGSNLLSTSSSLRGKKVGALNFRACRQFPSSTHLQDQIGKIKAYSTPLPKSLRPFNHQTEIQFSQGNRVQLVFQDKMNLNVSLYASQEDQSRASP